MGKSKTKETITITSLPTAPWIYLNDPFESSQIASRLSNLIPKNTIITQVLGDTVKQLTDSSYKDVVVILASNLPEACTEVKQSTASQFRETAVTHSRNFASINISYSQVHEKESGWGTNHLEVSASVLTAQDIAEKIYKWLFKVLSVQETLHLIPEKEMRAIDTKSFPDYEYCPISESHKRPENAKIQFVVLVISKATVGPGRKLQWTVADRTGLAKFYFQWRGPESQYTWDWVLKLQPGERRALPRMPAIEINETKLVSVAKAPFRAVGFVVGGTGHVMKGVGHRLSRIGDKVKMGSRSQWVPEADVTLRNGKHVTKSSGAQVSTSTKTEIKVFDEKGQKLWKDDDGDASTTAGSIFDEKVGQGVF